MPLPGIGGRYQQGLGGWQLVDFEALLQPRLEQCRRTCLGLHCQRQGWPPGADELAHAAVSRGSAQAPGQYRVALDQALKRLAQARRVRPALNADLQQRRGL